MACLLEGVTEADRWLCFRGQRGRAYLVIGGVLGVAAGVIAPLVIWALIWGTANRTAGVLCRDERLGTVARTRAEHASSEACFTPPPRIHAVAGVLKSGEGSPLGPPPNASRISWESRVLRDRHARPQKTPE
jgi:hypothetical protein